MCPKRIHRQLPLGAACVIHRVVVEQHLHFALQAAQRFGRIAVGMQADLMHLAANPMEVAPHDVAGIKIRAVYKSGIRVIG